MSSMNTNSGETLSNWMEIVPFLPQKLPESNSCDVCVIGAGIAGLSTAYFLAKQGRSVRVVDMGPLGGGQTGRTSAHLTWVTDERFYKLAQRFGEEKISRVIQSHREAIDQIEQIVRDEGLACDFSRVDGYLFCPEDRSPMELRKDLAFLHQLGYQDVHLELEVPVASLEAGPALHYPKQAQFHPMKYMKGLARAIEKSGGCIELQTKVERIEGGDAPKVTLADGRVIEAGKIVVASNTPINDILTIHTKQAPYRSYVLAARIPKGSVPVALYWDTMDPYHFVRVTRDEKDPEYDLLVVGGEDHKTGQEVIPQHHITRLKEWAMLNFPMILSFENEWSGQIWESNDGLAFIGRNPGDKNVFIITGDTGQGLTYGTIAGMMLKDLIWDNEHIWSDLYDPSRKMFGASLEFLKENLNVAWQYSDYLVPSELLDIRTLPPGEGVIMQKGFRKVAVSKDANGNISEVSAICPHLGGIVHWNSVEKSWDCPCHGSRFAPDGGVMTGPALHGLAEKPHKAGLETTAQDKRGSFDRNP